MYTFTCTPCNMYTFTCTPFCKGIVFELKVVNWREKKTPRMSVSKVLLSFLTFLLNALNIHILKLWKNMIMNYSLEHFLKRPEMSFDIV